MSNGCFGVHTQHEFASLSAEHILNEVEMRQSTDGDEQRDVGAAQFEHCAVVHATAQQTIARDRPRLRAAVVAVVPDHNTLPHNTTHTHTPV